MVLNVTDALAAYRQSGGISPDKAAGSGNTVGAKGSFGDVLKEYADDTINALHDSEKAATDAVTGKADLTHVVTAVAKAQLMLQTVVTIRDKVISAYQDIVKTSV